MAIQFPNFLAAQLVRPDYSGLGDSVQNYYAGKAMPKDDLIKAVQARFAEPNAKAALQGTQLENRHKQMIISHLANEIAQEKQFQQLLNKAMSPGSMGQNASGLPQAISKAMSPAPSYTPIGSPAPMPYNPANSMATRNDLQDMGTDVSKMDPRFRKFDQMGDYAAGGSQANQMAQNSPQPESSETVLSQGSPHLYGVDMLYENNPLSRNLLEKKGYKKTEQVKFDNKTGKTSIITKYPSGKITVQSMGGTSSDEGIPLTNKMVSTHQRVISSVDNALPQLQRLKDMDSHSNIYGESFGGNLFATHNQKKYQRLVNAVKENLIGAFALNPTEAGLQTAIDQLTIGGWESEKDYKNAIQDLIDDLKEKKSYSAREVKKSNKIQPISRMSDNSDEMDHSDLMNFDDGVN